MKEQFMAYLRQSTSLQEEQRVTLYEPSPKSVSRDSTILFSEKPLELNFCNFNPEYGLLVFVHFDKYALTINQFYQRYIVIQGFYIAPEKKLQITFPPEDLPKEEIRMYGFFTKKLVTEFNPAEMLLYSNDDNHGYRLSYKKCFSLEDVEGSGGLVWKVTFDDKTE